MFTFRPEKPLALWNAGLALFSILGTWVTGSEMIEVLSTKGFYDSVCNNSYISNNWVYFWFWLWTWSKLAEFGDTAFLVLRKKPLTFLHVYHHSLTAFVAFYFWHAGLPINRWCITMNFFVHSLMYTYFSLTAYGVKIPKPFAIIITLTQIIQMIIGCVTSSYVIYTMVMRIQCVSSTPHNIGCFLTYVSYAILFIHMFQSKYLRKSKKTKPNSEKIE
ncbi:elongation of very long chain fatty acids protein 6-like [Panonychus citri]|uniref:elongation of very long chain fatty acids protein 6-like n=1 Tax=Panonychus citri TaxID=50023 RepID=UPI002308316E|nr:elongation of very long chain fatty acids protein 6-like [Panonychus citri]